MQAIQTRFLGPTNTRGSRYKAVCDAGSLTLESDHSLGSEDNHVRVARALLARLKWTTADYPDWYYGSSPDGKGYTFVCAVGYARITI